MTKSVLDDVAGPRADPQEAAAEGVRLGEEAAGARAEDELARADRGCPTRSAQAVYARLHGLDAPTRARCTVSMHDRRRLDVTIITGMSGAGRSEAAHVLEDLGFFVIDNLPPMLIGKVAELARGRETPTRYALVVDVRSGDFLARPRRPRSTSCSGTARTTRILFLDARRRRARAPVRGEPPPAPAVRLRPRQRRHRARARAARAAQGRGRPARRHVEPQRARAARPAARALLRRTPATAALQVNVVSFGYKHGLPLDVDLVFDCRFLPNPHWVEELRPLTGLDEPVPRLRARAARYRRVPRRARPAVRAPAARLRARGQGVPVDRRRLHRRPAPQRGHRGAAGRAAAARRAIRTRCTTGTSSASRRDWRSRASALLWSAIRALADGRQRCRPTEERTTWRYGSASTGSAGSAGLLPGDPRPRRAGRRRAGGGERPVRRRAHDGVPAQARLRRAARCRTRSRTTDSGFSVDGARDQEARGSASPAEIPWGDNGVDVVIESTGLFTAREKAAGAPQGRRQAGRHLRAERRRRRHDLHGRERRRRTTRRSTR